MVSRDNMSILSSNSMFPTVPSPNHSTRILPTKKVGDFLIHKKSIGYMKVQYPPCQTVKGLGSLAQW